jgi:hypothetical protein
MVGTLLDCLVPCASWVRQRAVSNADKDIGLQAIVMIISSPIAGALLGVGTIEQIKPRFTAPIILCSVMVSLAVGFVIWARLHRSRRLGSKI